MLYEFSVMQLKNNISKNKHNKNENAYIDEL